MKKTLWFGSVAASLAALLSCAPAMASGPVLVPGPAFPLVEESRIDFDGELLGRPLALGSDVVLSIASGRVLAMSPATKKIVWQFAAAAPLSVPALAGPDFVIIFDQGGRMTRLGTDGKTAWEKAVKGAISALPVLSSGTILAVFDRRTLWAFDPATGGEKWSWTADEDIRTGPRPWGKRIVLLTAAKKAVILTAEGKAVPRFETIAAASGPLFISGDRMFAGLENGTLESWDLAAARKRWTVKTGAALAADPVSDGSRIYLVTESRQLFAIEMARGNVAWWQSLPSRPVGEAVLCGTRLIAPALSSVLTAFEPLTGKKAETNDLQQEAIAAPLIQGERVIVAVRDPSTLKGTLVVLRTKPKTAPPAPAPKKKSPSGEKP